jgi:oligopeptide/dipeptide ABC transporter ATP-binding protein
MLLAVRGLSKHYPVGGGLFGGARGVLRALDGVDLDLAAGATVGIVGESGSGKTTLARCLLRLVEPTGGRVLLHGEDLLQLRPRALRARRKTIQMVFQDPYGSLDPRQRVGSILDEPLQVHRLGTAAERRRRVAELLSLVGLPEEAAARYPHEFSGGQRQRIGIARALAPGPELLVADEPVSALDVSVRAQILNLLAELQQRLGLAMVFIGHDLAVVEQVADRTAVMYLGRVVEEGPTAELLASPQHPYTAGLIATVPSLDPGAARPRPPLGEVPDAANPPGGCAYHPRCPIAAQICRDRAPNLAPVTGDPGSGRRAACHFPGVWAPPPPGNGGVVS